MDVLVRHIENLLPEHDCVVVPGLGGFVQNEVRSRIDEVTGIIYPATKEICFNPRLKFNDGLLAQSYQEIFGLSFEEAVQQIQISVQEIVTKLNEGKYVRIGRIGTMTKTDEQLVFRPDFRNHFLPESYGLAPFGFSRLKQEGAQSTDQKQTEVQKLQQAFRPSSSQTIRDAQLKESRHHTQEAEEQAERQVELDNAILLVQALRAQGYIPEHKRRQASVSVKFLMGVAVFLLVLLITKPIGTVGNQQEANLMMHHYLGKTTGQQQQVKFINFADSINADLTIEATNETIRSVIENAAEAILHSKHTGRVYQERPETTLLSVLQETLTYKGRKQSKVESEFVYKLVVGTFSSRASAETWLVLHNSEPALKDAEIIESEGWFRIGTGNFKNKVEADRFLRQYTNSYPEYSSAWIFTYAQ